MRTVHETEALRPSDPVPKHHSSNPTNNKQRIKLVLNNETKKAPHDKGSTPGSPSSHSHHPPNSASIPPPAAPTAPDADYAHNNIIHLQDLTSGATLVQLPPDIEFTEQELRLPAPDLFQLLRKQLAWATQEGDELRAQAEELEKKRLEEWQAKELLFENYMEAETAKERRRRIEQGMPENMEGWPSVENDVLPSKSLPIAPKDGKLPWWRQEGKEEASRPPPADIRHEEQVPVA
jgi:hypothetical protein